MNLLPGNSRSLLRVAVPSLALALALAGPAPGQAPAPVAVSPAAASPTSGSLARDVELGRRLDALLAAPDPETAWSINVEVVLVRDSPVRRIRLWSDGLGIWENESQFRLPAEARREVLKAFRDNGFCLFNDELYHKGSGARRNPNVLIQEHAITLEIGGVSKTVAHIVSSFGRVPDVEEGADSLRKIASVVQKVCEKPAAAGIRAKDLGDGLSKVAAGQLADVTFQVSVTRPQEPGGTGWMTHVEGRRVTTREATKAKGWAAPVELLLTDDELATLVRALSAAKPGSFPQNVYDEGYTDLSVSVLNRSVTSQARPFTGMDPKAHEEIRTGYRAAVDAVRKLHQRALREAGKPRP